MRRQPVALPGERVGIGGVAAPALVQQPFRVLRTAWEYVRFGVDFFILRRDHPYLLGLVTNDTCNLHCIHCRVANRGAGNMSFAVVAAHLRTYYARGARFLYLEGGETYLWRDGQRRLQDVIDLARAIGYLRVHVYTNGTFPLTAEPDFTWISIDGLENSYRQIRGIPLEHVLRHVRDFRRRFAIIFVVNTINRREIRPFLAFVQRDLPRARVMFFFHTPYYGVDDLLLSSPQKRAAVATILACKDEDLPVLNSRAGLTAIASGQYEHPTTLWWVVDQAGEYPCCRAVARPEVCRECGYASCAELVLMRAWRLEAVWTMLRCI